MLLGCHLNCHLNVDVKAIFYVHLATHNFISCGLHLWYFWWQVCHFQITIWDIHLKHHLFENPLFTTMLPKCVSSCVSIWTWNFTQNIIFSLEFMNFFWFWLKPHLKIHVSLTFRVVSLVRLENVLDLYKSWFDVNFHLEAYLKFNLIPWETRRLLNPFTWNIVTWHI